MNRSFSTFRQFSLRSLLAAGAVASLGLPLGREALGIGGSAIQPTYVPRETIGATPTTSLIGGSSSGSYSVAAASSSASSGGGEMSSSSSNGTGRTRHITSDDEGHGTTAKRHQRKKEKAGTTAVVDNSKEATDHKQTSPLLVAPALGPQFSLSAGYETRYIFHGQDVLSFYGRNNSKVFSESRPSSGIVYSNADVTYKGLHLGVEYLNSVDKIDPFLQLTTRYGVQVVDPTLRYYNEVDVDLDYTVAVVANILDATLGYNSYIIPNNDFKGTNYQSEVIFRLAYKQIPYIIPNFTFYHDFSEQHNDQIGNLNGSLVEFRLDGTVPIIKKENFSLTFAPYVSSIYNINYLNYTGERNGNIGGISSLQTGIRLPVTFAKHFTITPYGNYGMDLTADNRLSINNFSNLSFGYNASTNSYTEHGAPGERTHFWGGVTVTYSF